MACGGSNNYPPSKVCGRDIRPDRSVACAGDCHVGIQWLWDREAKGREEEVKQKVALEWFEVSLDVLEESQWTA